MSSEVNELIAAFRNGTITLEEVAQRFVNYFGQNTEK